MVKYIMGAADLSDTGTFSTPALRAEVLTTLLSEGITHLDTALAYPGSEAAIGALADRTRFTIDTKVAGGYIPGSSTSAGVLAAAQGSLWRAKIPRFDVLYLHAPDADVGIEDTLAGINEAYQRGMFARFGLSNFPAAQVRRIHGLAREKGFVLPSVCQGLYSPVSRLHEADLFPTLRDLGIKFYAYSPLAGGFLTKSCSDLDEGAGRFHAGFLDGLYSRMFDKPEMREALVAWRLIAEREGVSTAELAYRWVAHHSAIAADEENGIVFGATCVEQVRSTVQGLKRGRLSDEAVRAVEEVWESVREVAPGDTFFEAQKM